MIKKGLLIIFLIFLTACAVKPKSLSIDDRYNEAQEDVKELFSPQKNVSKHLNYYEALARALKFNLDYRIKLANYALQAGQLRVAEFTMFPALNASGSLYTRSNNMASFGISAEGQPTGTLISTPRTLRTARVALTWNVLDFGLGYVKAKQQGERILIAEEETRKQEQTLAQDVLVAYWEAYNAQQLLRETKEFQRLLNEVKVKLERAVRDKLVPQENLLEYQGTIFEGNRRIVQLEYKYYKAILDLRHLLSLSPDQDLILDPPPAALSKIQNLSALDFEKLDAVTLVKRPELRGEEYQKRIAELGVQIAILQALPGITLNDGWNYNSNKFIINSKWMDRSMDLAWNLLNLASLPSTYDAAQLGVKYEKLKRMALTIAVLTETRYAYWHYQTLSEELQIVHKETENANAQYTLNRNRRIASLASDQQVILTKLRAITTLMDEQLLMSDLATALGELYLSTGSDILPIDVDTQSIPELTHLIQENFALENTLDFSKYIDTVYAEIFASPHIIKTVDNGSQKTKPPTADAVGETKTPSVLTRIKDFFKFKHQPVVTAQAQPTAPVTPAPTVIATKTPAPAPTITATKTPAPATTDPIQLLPQATLPKPKPVAENNETNLPTPSSKYTVQVFGSYDLDAVKNFQVNLPDFMPSQIGKTERNGKDWFVLTLGQFQTAHAARKTIEYLPKRLKDASAWVRKSEGVTWVA